MPKDKIEFKEIPITTEYSRPLYRIFYVIDNGKSIVIEKIVSLPQKDKALIKDLIRKMATIEDFKSNKIRFNLKGYNFGEIKPFPHRFFFFQKCGKNYIFFDYKLKKTDKFNDKIYKEIDKRKKKYEEEFKRYFQRI